VAFREPAEGGGGQVERDERPRRPGARAHSPHLALCPHGLERQVSTLASTGSVSWGLGGSGWINWVDRVYYWTGWIGGLTMSITPSSVPRQVTRAHAPRHP
jgi:hypothetical protein